MKEPKWKGYEYEPQTLPGVPNVLQGFVRMEKEFKFEPWKEFADKAPISLPITEPPCKNCKWFKPRVTTNRNGEFDGVVLCTRNGMSNDFSCFNRDEY